MGEWIHQGGFSLEAANAVIDFGIADLEASKITTSHAPWNTPSKRVIEKPGFRFAGENPCGFIKQGNPVSEYEYTIESKML